MIRNTATKHSPWYVVPADNKWFTRVVVAAAVVDTLASLDLAYPKLTRQDSRKSPAQSVPCWSRNKAYAATCTKNGSTRNDYGRWKALHSRCFGVQTITVASVFPSSPGRQSRSVEKIRQTRMIGFPLNRQYERQPKLEQQPAIVAPTAPGLVALRSGSHRAGHRGRHHPCSPRHTRSYGLHQDHRHAGDHRALHPLLTSPDIRPLRLLAAPCCQCGLRPLWRRA